MIPVKARETYGKYELYDLKQPQGCFLFAVRCCAGKAAALQDAAGDSGGLVPGRIQKPAHLHQYGACLQIFIRGRGPLFFCVIVWFPAFPENMVFPRRAGKETGAQAGRHRLSVEEDRKAGGLPYQLQQPVLQLLMGYAAAGEKED